MGLLNRIEELEKELLELKEQVKEQQEFPQVGDTYYYIESNGRIGVFSWNEATFDLQAQEVGNIFHTEEEAEFAVEKLRVEAELRKYSRTFKHGGDNYALNFNHDGGKIVHVYASESYEELGSLYFESRDKAQQAIDEVGEERIKKYIFGVEG